MDKIQELKGMQDSLNVINAALKGLTGYTAAVIVEDVHFLDVDVDPRRAPVKGEPEDFEKLRHRGTV